METKFEIKTKFNKERLVKINRIELKMVRKIFLVLFLLGTALAIVNLILQTSYGAVLSQDIKNLIIAVLGLAAIFFLPELLSLIQIPVYKRNHLDGERIISFTDDAIKIQQEKYEEKIFKFSLITKVLDRPSYYKIMIGSRPLYIHKEDFIKGDPEYFLEYIKSELKR